MELMSNLDIIKAADAFPYEGKEADKFSSLSADLYTLKWKDGRILGYMLSATVSELVVVPESIRGHVTVDEAERTVHAFEGGATEAERTRNVAAVMSYWRQNDTFEILRGWRDERWPVYGSADEVLFSVERSATGLLGVVRYGIHMTGYIRDEDGKGIRIWVPRRAADKSTYPGMLDNTAAGGYITGEDPFEAMVREADEEADIPESLMRERAKYAGMVTYIYVTDERAGGKPLGQIYPEMQWLYDIEMPADFLPSPKDGEVADFCLLSVEEVQKRLAEGQFKPNCALVLLHFFVCHGILTRENEPDFDEIVRHMHRKHPFPGPHDAPPPVPATDLTCMS